MKCEHDWEYGPIDMTDGVRKFRWCGSCSRHEARVWVEIHEHIGSGAVPSEEFERFWAGR